MNCEEALELISGHIDESNTQEEEAQLQAHLASCAACRAILSAYEELDTGLATLKAEPPAELAAGVMDAIRQEASASRKIRRFPARGIAATAVAAALLLVIGTTYLPTLNRGNEEAAVPDATSYTVDSTVEESAALAKTLPPTDDDAADTADSLDKAMAEEPEVSADMPSAEVPQSDSVTTAVSPAGVQAFDNASSGDSVDTIQGDTTPDSLTVAPSVMTADAPSNAVQEAFPDGNVSSKLMVELVDNPDAPAAVTIAELAQLTAEATATDRIVFYTCTVSTVRQIVAAYDAMYEFETPAQLDTAADSDSCGLLVIQP